MFLVIVSISILLCEAGALEYKEHDRVQLLNHDNRPLNIKELEPGILYVYSYPYEGTPSVIMKSEIFDENNRSSYSIVSYLAINPKTYEFVNDDISVLSFYKDEKTLRFCDDKGTYNINSGENVLDGNMTKTKMTRVILEYDENNRISAVGLSDDEIVKTFFKDKKTALTKRYRSIWSAKKSHSRQKVEPLEEFSLVTVRCNEKMPLIAEDINNSDDNQTDFIETEENITE